MIYILLSKGELLNLTLHLKYGYVFTKSSKITMLGCHKEFLYYFMPNVEINLLFDMNYELFLICLAVCDGFYFI